MGLCLEHQRAGGFIIYNNDDHYDADVKWWWSCGSSRRFDNDDASMPWCRGELTMMLMLNGDLPDQLKFSWS